MKRKRLNIFFWIVFAGCDSHAELAQSYRLAQAHVDEFIRIDTWVRRTVAARPGFVSDEAMQEAAFAQLRPSKTAVCAWVETGWQHRIHFSYPTKANRPHRKLDWLPLRFQHIGGLRMARTMCPRSDSSTAVYTQVPCVLLSREGADTRGRITEVIVGFRTDGL